MKHRSVVISAVFVMLMVVGPQAAQQFSALKEAAGNRLQAGIWNVFLSYHAQQIESPERSTRTPSAAACDVQIADASVKPVRRTRKNAAHAETKNEAHATGNRHAQTVEIAPALNLVAANLKGVERLERIGEEVLKAFVHPLPAHVAPPAPVAFREVRSEAVWEFENERESIRRELRNDGREKETARRLAHTAERTLRLKTAANEASLRQLDVLKVVDFDAFDEEHDSHLKARKTRVRPRLILPPAKPTATGTRLAPRPAASVVAC